MKKSIVYLLIMFLTPLTGRSEFFIDAFGGFSYVQSGSFSASNRRYIGEPGESLSTAQGDLDGSTSFTTGVRGGYWIGTEKLQWLGAAVDLSGFQADAQDTGADATIYTASLMLMFRYPLVVCEEYPKGQFQPYAGIGISRATVDISASSDSVNGSVDSDMGGLFCAGAKWMFTPWFGLFAEYRAISITFDGSSSYTTGTWLGIGVPHENRFEAEGDVTTHQFVSGVSFHF